MANFKLPLGAKVRDKITGFTGIVTARHEWLYGCLTYSVQPRDLHEGKPVDRQPFDEDSLEFIELAHGDATEPTTGGPARGASRPNR